MEFLEVVFSLIAGIVLVGITSTVGYVIFDTIESELPKDGLGIFIAIKIAELLSVSYLIYLTFKI